MEKFCFGFDGQNRFGVDECGRAFIEEVIDSGCISRMFFFFIWQESWSGLMVRKKFICGKIVYHKDVEMILCDEHLFIFLRQFEFTDDKLAICLSSYEEMVDVVILCVDF